ncbi:MAG: ABC transporter permease [Thermomicrobiales bacterium]
MSLQAYVARRVLLLLPLIGGITLLTFVVSHFVPSDPLAANLGDRALANPEIVAAYRRKWGLDRPLPEQYLRYLGGLVRGDFGDSLSSRRPVRDDLRQYLPATLELATTAMAISVIVGIPLGIVAAVHRGRFADQVVRVGTLLGASVPIFWLALLALILFYTRLGWAPAPGRLDPRLDPPPTVTGMYTVDALVAGEWRTLGNALWHLALPALTLAAYQLAYIVRVTRSSMVEAIGQDYVRTARAKGLRERAVTLRHAARNAMIPTVIYLGLGFGGLLAGTVITETIFSWPGLGRYAFRATKTLDFPAIMSVTTVIAVIYVTVNLVVDVIQVTIDPRVRVG